MPAFAAQVIAHQVRERVLKALPDGNIRTYFRVRVRAQDFAITAQEWARCLNAVPERANFFLNVIVDFLLGAGAVRVVAKAGD